MVVPARTGLDPDPTVMLLDELSRDRETEAGSLTRGLRGVERLEDVGEHLVRDAGTPVLDVELDDGPVRRRGDDDRSVPLARLGRVDGVGGQVQHDLSQHATVATNLRDRLEMDLDLRAAPCLVTDDGEHRLHDRGQVHRLVASGGVRQAEQFVEDDPDSCDAFLGLRQHLLELDLGVRLAPELFEVVEVRGDERDGVVDLVREARGQGSHRGQCLGVRQLQVLLAQGIRSLQGRSREQVGALFDARHRLHEAAREDADEAAREHGVARRDDRGRVPEAESDAGIVEKDGEHDPAREQDQAASFGGGSEPACIAMGQEPGQPDVGERHHRRERGRSGVHEERVEACHGSHDRLPGVDDARYRGEHGRGREHRDGDAFGHAKRLVEEDLAESDQPDVERKRGSEHDQPKVRGLIRGDRFVEQRGRRPHRDDAEAHHRQPEMCGVLTPHRVGPEADRTGPQGDQDDGEREGSEQTHSEAASCSTQGPSGCGKATRNRVPRSLFSTSIEPR